MDIHPPQELPAPSPPPVKRRPHGIVTTLLWLALSAACAVSGAWLIAAPVVSRTWESLFWPCFVWTLVANILFFTFNIIEGGIVCLVSTTVAAISIPVFQRFGILAPPHIALVALIGGFVSSRILYARLS